MSLRKLALILLISMLILTGCNEKSDDELINEKINSEMEYLESNIISISKKYASGNYYLESNQINWDDINTDFSLIENSYDVILIDLASKQIDRKKILQLETNIDEVSTAINNKDDLEFLRSICNAFSTIPDILTDLNQNQTLIKVEQIKSNLLKASYFIQNNDYIKAYECINIAENLYNELIEKREYLEANSYKINKNYVKLQDMKRALEGKNLYEFNKDYLEILEWF